MKPLSIAALALVAVLTVTTDQFRGVFAAPSRGGVIDVRDAASLASAISRASGGERIRLAPGNYGVVAIRGRDFATPVTIVGPAGAARARFDTLRIVDSKGLRLEALDIGQDQEASDGAYARIQQSGDVQVSGIRVHGSLDGNPRNDGVGLHVTESSNVSVTSSEFVDVRVGVMIAKSESIRVAQNFIHMIRSDGIISSGSQKLRFEGNYITDFYPDPEDHSDGIQLHNTNTPKGTEDVVIADNVILQGAGERLQGIWISDGQTNPHRNLTITNNLIYINDYHNGIGLNNVMGAKVSNNTVVSETTDKEMAWIRVQNSSDVTVENNVSDLFLDPKNVENLVKRGNIFAGKAPGRCRPKNLDARAATRIPDLMVPGVGFTPSAAIHPSLWRALEVEARAATASPCRGDS